MVAIRYYRRMNLSDLYKSEGIAALGRLADATQSSRKYLYQCATTSRRPSPDLAVKLIAADPRLTLDDLYAASKQAV
ncbi:hypothetical protein [Denitromonas halophila]|uniref:Helix-turn-helix domain-containing protein n=1 Tax=Denitromonas halophila TaxID=1629404 RepID=A0A557QLQ2_9RHOO|nr:hypothetical protein [Denitromonas halophila]TVO53832.1 hypothetical protein FHP91_13625 [Denitromonas halophila]